jgi:hypothetical protein
MIPINRETLMIAATIICAIGILFLFREMNKTKEEMAQVIKHMNTVRVPTCRITEEPVQEPDQEPVESAVPTPEKDVAP